MITLAHESARESRFTHRHHPRTSALASTMESLDAIALLSAPFLSRCKRSPNLARGLDESLRGGAECAILQCHYSVRHARDRKFDRQNLYFGAPTEELQYRSRQN